MDNKLKRVGITGPKGFLGRHANWLFSTKKEEIEIVPITITNLQNSEELKNLLAGLDAIVHLARVHPLDVSNPEDVYSGNIDLANKLLSGLDEIKSKPYIIFGSSTQINKDNPYGRAKKDIGKMFRDWGEKNNSFVTNLIIPNEFGESATPGRISVVSTFCDDLVTGKESKVSDTAVVSLVHAQDVVKKIYELILEPKNEDVTLQGVEMSVLDLYKTLSEFKNLYYMDIVPNLKDSLHTSLFNNLRWHIFYSNFYPKKLVLKTDERGSLFEVVKGYSGGQTFTSSTKPNITRGNHYHTRKTERFCVIKGQAQIELRLISDDKVHKFIVDGDNPVYIDMPTFFTHNIKNIGEGELQTLFWTNEIFDSNDTDTYYQIV
jgi:UDP-2-acetamido-2,6-beta-L-arabino-hexul-4-ose reductase